MFINKDKRRLDAIYTDLIRYWLMGILLFIPFVNRVADAISLWSNELAVLCNRLDEFTLVIFFPLAIIEFCRDYKRKIEPEPLYLLLFFPLVMLGVIGLISGLINDNTLLTTILGVFAYIKYFLFVFVYAAFFRNFDTFLKLFRVLVFVAVVIGVVAVIQEVWIFYITYFADKNSSHKGTYFFISELLDLSNVMTSGISRRLGIYRVSSLVSHYNLLGLYSLLVLTIYLHIIKKANFAVIFFLLSGIVASVSRTAYAGLALLAGVQIFKGRKWFIFIMIPFAVVLIYMFFMISHGDFNISKTINEKYIEKSEATQPVNISTYRKFARQKAMEVWKDYPVWGVGPGKFGGAVAYKYRSHFYEEYNFTYVLNWFHSLEQLWPQVLAEMGIIGAVALGMLFFSMGILLYISKQRATFHELKGLFAGLLTFTLIFLIYTMSGTLDLVSILLPYCAFIGIGLGSMRPSSAYIVVEKTNSSFI